MLLKKFYLLYYVIWDLQWFLGSVWCPKYDEFCINQNKFRKGNFGGYTRNLQVLKPSNVKEEIETTKVASKAGALVAWTVITLISCLMLSLAVITVFRSLPPKQAISNNNSANSFRNISTGSNHEFVSSGTKSSDVLKSFTIDMAAIKNHDLCFSRN